MLTLQQTVKQNNLFRLIAIHGTTAIKYNFSAGFWRQVWLCGIKR